MHTQASQTFRQHCIAGHTQQCFASIMTMRYLMSRFSAAGRHRARLLAAINNMERIV